MRKSTAVFSAVLSIMIFFTSICGTFATWTYAKLPVANGVENIEMNLGNFDYTPPLPDDEVMFLQRMDDILNQKYTTENVKDSRDYLLNETIKVEWEPGAPPYVGSMDQDYQTQIHELFGDIVDTYNVSFILKNEDLNWDGYNEIACYSTSDPLDCCETGVNGIVGVYLTVFTPYLDENRNVVGYKLVCDSLYGFCNEVHYSPVQATVSSFSTTDWRDTLTYWHHIYDTVPVPDNAVANDGVSLYKYHYESYHSRMYRYEGYPYQDLIVNVWIQLGNSAGALLWDKIPCLGY